MVFQSLRRFRLTKSSVYLSFILGRSSRWTHSPCGTQFCWLSKVHSKCIYGDHLYSATRKIVKSLPKFLTLPQSIDRLCLVAQTEVQCRSFVAELGRIQSRLYSSFRTTCWWSSPWSLQSTNHTYQWIRSHCASLCVVRSVPASASGTIGTTYANLLLSRHTTLLFHQ